MMSESPNQNHLQHRNRTSLSHLSHHLHGLTTKSRAPRGVDFQSHVRWDPQSRNEAMRCSRKGCLNPNLKAQKHVKGSLNLQTASFHIWRPRSTDSRSGFGFLVSLGHQILTLAQVNLFNEKYTAYIIYHIHWIILGMGNKQLIKNKLFFEDFWGYEINDKFLLTL